MKRLRWLLLAFAAGCGGTPEAGGGEVSCRWFSPGPGFAWDREALFVLVEAPAFTLRPGEAGRYEFRVTEAGALRGVCVRKNGETVELAFEASVKPRGAGWTIEARIPWREFLPTGGRPEPGDRWSLDAERTLLFEAPPGREAWRKRFPPPAGSRVLGSPDPPAPYRAERVYPKLEMSFPIAVQREPGSELLWCIDEVRAYGKSSVRRFRAAEDVAQSEKLLEVDGVAYGLAFHPRFAENRWVFLGWNGGKKTRVTRYTAGKDVGSPQLILEWDSDGHNGGDLAFGKDGFLYVTSGDGTSDSDTHVVGQDLSRLTAKVLRIDVDRPDPGRAYGVPKDNPFVGIDGVRPETWAYGLRNPWRLSVDPVSGRVWVGNNGQDLWEQVYLVEKGANYGWSLREGSHPFYPDRKQGPTPLMPPTLEHSHAEARSLTGGLVYHGERFPELRGAYLYADYSTGKIWAALHDGTRLLWRRELADTSLQITGFGLDPRGELLLCDHRGDGKGGFYTLRAAPPEAPRAEFPRTLSASGLFRSVAGHRMEPGLIPYSVNAPLWSDGARKERWIALPAGTAIDFTTSRGWNFPDGTVLVKSFALDTDAGRRWIETRFLTRQDGEWAGYSYAWNDAQTEGTLVDAGGAERDWTIGGRRQTWRFPSRAECMVCHSRAANFVLGLSELQMNRDHDYDGVRAPQLEVLESLGLLRVDWAKEAVEGLKREAKEIGRDVAAYVRERRGPTPDRSALLDRPPGAYRRLADPSDPREELERRARSYLHANCAHCHVEAGGGNAQMELELTTPREGMRVVDVPPLHPLEGLRDARLVAPGHPERSTLLARLARRGPGQMPPLATSVADAEAVELLRAWIQSLR